MIYFVTLIFLTILSGLLYKGKIISKKAASLVVSIYAIILYGLRTENVGNADIPRYVDAYKALEHISFFEVGVYFNKDAGFYLFSKLIAHFSSNYNIWFIVIGSLFIFSVSSLIKKHSNQLILSYIVFFTFYFTLNFSLLRHCLALAFIIFGYIAIKENKKKYAISLLSIATLFHLSAIVSFSFFIFKKVKFGGWLLLFIAGAYFLPALVPNFLPKIIDLLNLERLDSYADPGVMQLNYSAFIINLILLFVILILVSIKNKDLKEKYNFEMNLFGVGVALFSFVVILAEFYRLAMFFSFIVIILLPNVFSEFKSSKNKELINVVAFVFGVLLLIYFFRALSVGDLLPYEFNRIF